MGRKIGRLTKVVSLMSLDSVIGSPSSGEVMASLKCTPLPVLHSTMRLPLRGLNRFAVVGSAL